MKLAPRTIIDIGFWSAITSLSSNSSLRSRLAALTLCFGLELEAACFESEIDEAAPCKGSVSASSSSSESSPSPLQSLKGWPATDEARLSSVFALRGGGGTENIFALLLEDLPLPALAIRLSLATDSTEQPLFLAVAAPTDEKTAAPDDHISDAAKCKVAKSKARRATSDPIYTAYDVSSSSLLGRAKCRQSNSQWNLVNRNEKIMKSKWIFIATDSRAARGLREGGALYNVSHDQTVVIARYRPPSRHVNLSGPNLRLII